MTYYTIKVSDESATAFRKLIDDGDYLFDLLAVPRTAWDRGVVRIRLEQIQESETL